MCAQSSPYGKVGGDDAGEGMVRERGGSCEAGQAWK